MLKAKVVLFGCMWIVLNKILPVNIKKLGLGQVLEFGEICEKWDNELCNLCGSAYAGKTKPVSLKNKILTIDCLNSAWACQLQLKQESVISRLNESLKKQAVEKIRFIS